MDLDDRPFTVNYRRAIGQLKRHFDLVRHVNAKDNISTIDVSYNTMKQISNNVMYEPPRVSVWFGRIGRWMSGLLDGNSKIVIALGGKKRSFSAWGHFGYLVFY